MKKENIVAYILLILAVLGWAAWGVTTMLSTYQKEGGFYSPQFSGSGGQYCNIISYSKTIAATGTQQVDCGLGTSTVVAITNVKPTDKIVMSLPSTTPETFEGLDLMWVAPSTTPGYITMLVYNGSGNTFSWSASASTSAPYIDAK